jgi:Uma2 family endonuclease
MSAQPQAHLTPEQYLAIERAAETRSEYYDGRMYAMSGGSYNHVRIIGNLAFELRNALKQRACEVVTSDLRLRVSPSGLYTYPDVTVVCGEPKFADDQRDTLLNPAFIAEVLSPSTEAYDRGFKSAQYRKLESLQEYALISQAEPRVEVFRRQPGGGWLLSESAGLDATCRIDCLECRIALAEIYGKVTFETGDLIPPRPPVSM